MASSTSLFLFTFLLLISSISSEDQPNPESNLSPKVGNSSALQDDQNHQEDRQLKLPSPPPSPPSPDAEKKRCMFINVPRPINNQCLNNPDCHTVCQQVPERVCQNVTEQHCQVFNVTTCNMVQEEVCHPYNITRLDNQCEFKYEEECQIR